MCRDLHKMEGFEYAYDPEDTYRKLLNSDSKQGFLDSYSEEMFNLNVTKASGFNITKNLLQCEWLSMSSVEGETTVITPCGKPEFVRGLNEWKIPATCYTLKVNDYEEELQGDSTLRMVLLWQISDFINTGFVENTNNLRKYWINFHHPGHDSNPFAEGFQFHQGKSYKVKLSQVDTIRLPPPYSTKCYDYKEQWKKNGFKGPLGRQDCQNICEVKLNFEKFGCVPRVIDYPHEKELCFELKPYDLDLKKKVRRCKEECREACTETMYFMDSEQSGKFNTYQAREMYGNFYATILEVFFDNQNSQTLVYRPKYESVELFSYIGGYLGMWLGWSLLAVFDFVEILFNVCMYPFSIKKES